MKTDKFYLAAYGGWKSDKLLRHSDNNPNRAGANRAAGRGLAPTKDLLKAVEDGAIRGVVTLGPAGEEKVDQLDSFKKLTTMVSLSSNIGAFTEAASIVIPVAHYAEMDGTFVNAVDVVGASSRFAPQVGDLNSDATPDTVVLSPDGRVLYRQGRADDPGTFDPPLIVNPSSAALSPRM